MYNDVLFNSVDLTELNGVKITSVISDNIPQVIINSGKNARQDGAKLFNKEYGAKIVTVEGYIARNSRETYVATRNELLKYLEPLESTLRVPIFNAPIEYTATVQNTIFSDVGGGYGKFSIEFLCSDPFGYDVDSRTIINGTTVTAASSDISLSEAVGGSYKTPPIITVTVTAVSGGTGKYIDLANEAGNNIRVTRDWVADDQLVIDMLNKTLRVNGASLDYTGTFWDLNVDDTLITYSDNFTTSRSVNILATYKRRYL
jgi:predicted phage tail component-like protein